MDQTLPFFPESFPDETLWSRVSRYHILTGNAGEGATFKELFGVPMALEQVVPTVALLALAPRLPDPSAETITRIIRENTLLPAFSPFLGGDGEVIAQELPLGHHYDGLGRIPIRVVGMYGGENRFCLTCLREDIAIHGTGYWHRSHQVPGVRACWKHGETLIANCPVCRRPVSRLKALLTLPWKPCRCSWVPEEQKQSVPAADAEKRYAEFAHNLIEKDLAPIRSSQLRDGYLAKLRKCGFTRGEKDIAPNAIREALEAEYGSEFISDIDPAYANGMRYMWLRFQLIDGQIEMPVMRHILLSMFLFKDVDDFAGHMARTPIPQVKPRREQAASAEDIPAPSVNEKRLKEMRDKVHRLQTRHPNLTLDDLWKKAYSVADWLYENDKAWLLITMRHHTDEEILLAETLIDDSFKAEDMALAKRIDQGIDALYEAAGKPKRVATEVIRVIAGKKIAPNKVSRERYPISHGRVERYIESYWHFSVRRFLYGVAEIRRLQEPVVVRNINKFSGLHVRATKALIEHFRWDLETMVAASYDLKGELARIGINRQWHGPVSIDEIGYGGRKYKKQDASPGRVNFPAALS